MSEKDIAFQNAVQKNGGIISDDICRQFGKPTSEERAEAEAAHLKEIADVAEAEAVELEAQAEAKRREAAEAAGKSTVTPSNEGEPKTAAEVLAMLDDGQITFFAFAAAAKKVIGEGAPSTKIELVDALKAMVAEQTD